jgi:MFS family permease
MEGGNMSKKYEQPTDFADAKKKLAEARRGRTIAENKLAALAEEKLALTELETDSFRWTDGLRNNLVNSTMSKPAISGFVLGLLIALFIWISWWSWWGWKIFIVLVAGLLVFRLIVWLLDEERKVLSHLRLKSLWDRHEANRTPAPASPPTPSKIIRSPNFQGWFSRGWQRFRGKSVTDIPPEEVKK